jgi:signal transduction histidine kinase/CheY-like chemotaxis protein
VHHESRGWDVAGRIVARRGFAGRTAKRFGGIAFARNFRQAKNIRNGPRAEKTFEDQNANGRFEPRKKVIKSETVFTLENANWPALLVDCVGNIRAVSMGAKNVFGQIIVTRPTLGQSVWSRENEQSPEEFFACYDEMVEHPYELRFKGRDGSTCSYQVHVCVLFHEGDELFLMQIFRTPAEEKEQERSPAPPVKPPEAKQPETAAVLEAGLAQKQKLDCAMQLIRTVALDFNNALTSILGHASLLLGKIESKHPLRNSLVEIEKSAQRAAEIANDLAAFSRQERDARAQTSGNVNEVLRRTVEFFRETQPETIVWKMEFQRGPYTANFDEAKMQQAFVKILENSVQAMDGFGTIQVTTRNIDAHDGFKDENIRLAPGAYVCAEIRDTGKGIVPDLLARIFEPFFTTKKSQGHRGLGLAWVYGIVTNHGGSVAVSSEVNKGTSVRVYLPAKKKVVKDRGPEPGDLTGTQTVLMIDDEDLLLTMGEMILSSYGYRVLTANSGQRGMEIFAEKAQEIDLVITDLVMPQMSGRELIERLRRISPGVKVICASGFVRPPSSEENENYLQKPFASQDLLRKVKQVLATDLDKS